MGHLPGLRTSLRIGWSVVSTSCSLKTQGIMGAPSARLDALFAVLNNAPPGRVLSDSEAQLKAGVGDGDVCCDRDDTSVGGDGDRTSFPALLLNSGTLVRTDCTSDRLPPPDGAFLVTDEADAFPPRSEPLAGPGAFLVTDEADAFPPRSEPLAGPAAEDEVTTFGAHSHCASLHPH